MKKLSATTVLLFLVLTAPAFAAGTIYHIFANGLTCRYCEFAVGKKLMQIQGVEFVDIFLEKGMINVRTAEGFELKEKQLRKLLDDAGVTFRRMEHHPSQ